jgi:hypothetical protein
MAIILAPWVSMRAATRGTCVLSRIYLTWASLVVDGSAAISALLNVGPAR